MRCFSHHYPKHVVFPHSILVSAFILILCREIHTGPLIKTNKTSIETTQSSSGAATAGKPLHAEGVVEDLNLPLQANGPAAQVEFPQTEINKLESAPSATRNPVTSIRETKPDVSSTQYVTSSGEVGTIVSHAVQTAVTGDTDVVTYYHSPSDITTDSSVALLKASLPTTKSQLTLHSEDTNTTSFNTSTPLVSNISHSLDNLGPTFRESSTSSPIVIETPSPVTNSSKEFVLGNSEYRNTTIKTVLRTGVVSSVSVVTHPAGENMTSSTRPPHRVLKNLPATEILPFHDSLNLTESRPVQTTQTSFLVLDSPPETTTDNESSTQTPTFTTSVNSSHEILHSNASVIHRPLLGTSTPSALLVAGTAHKLSNISVNTSSRSINNTHVTTNNLNLSISITTQKIVSTTPGPNDTTLTPLPSVTSAGVSNTTKEATTKQVPVISSVHVSEFEQSAATNHVQTTQEMWTVLTTLLPTKELSGTTETPTTKLISSDPTVLNIYHTEDPLGVGAIIGIILGVLGLVILVGGVCGFLIYHRRLRPLSEVKYPTDNCGYVDDSLRVSYVNNHIELPKESSEEMFSLDNDSFLNSLEAMTLQNYWAEDAKNTKV